MEKYSLYNQPIAGFLTDIQDYRNKCVVFLDTETTGLKGPKAEQLTQIAAVAGMCVEGEITPLNVYNQKIKLTKVTENRILTEADSQWNVKNILIFNHYHDWDKKYISESTAITNLFKWLDKNKSRYKKDVLLVIQNAPI